MTRFTGAGWTLMVLAGLAIGCGSDDGGGSGGSSGGGSGGSGAAGGSGGASGGGGSAGCGGASGSGATGGSAGAGASGGAAGSGGGSGGSGGSTGGAGGTGGGGASGPGKAVVSCGPFGGSTPGLHIVDVGADTSFLLNATQAGEVAINAKGTYVAHTESGTGAGASKTHIVDVATKADVGTFDGKPIAWIDETTLLAQLGTTAGTVYKPAVVGINGAKIGNDLGFTMLGKTRWALNPNVTKVVLRGAGSGGGTGEQTVTLLSDSTQKVTFPSYSAAGDPIWLRSDRVAWVTYGPATGTENKVYLANPATAGSAQGYDLKPATTAVIGGVVPWTADNQLLVQFNDTTRKMVIVDASNGSKVGEVAWLASLVQFDLAKLLVSSDGASVLYHYNGKLHTNKADGSAEKPVNVPCAGIWAFDWSARR